MKFFAILILSTVLLSSCYVLFQPAMDTNASYTFVNNTKGTISFSCTNPNFDSALKPETMDGTVSAGNKYTGGISWSKALTGASYKCVMTITGSVSCTATVQMDGNKTYTVTLTDTSPFYAVVATDGL